MANEESHNSNLQWKWVVIGVVVGAIIMTVSYLVITPTFHSIAIQALVMMVGFVLTGTIVGYFSPGITIREAMYAGVILLIVMGVMISAFNWGAGANRYIIFLLLLFGGTLAQVGGWIGEKLQGTLEKEGEGTTATGFQTKWVVVGTGLGLVLNILFVFLLARMLDIDLDKVFVAFSASFVVTGFIVGYKSPGVTLKEPAVAGAIAVLLEWLFVQYGLGLTVPATYTVFGIIEGFLLTLFGAWIGEKYQLASEKKAETV
jgi:hypothetical protein